MSSSINILAPTETLSNMIYCDAYREDMVHIRCNSPNCDTSFFQGDDWEHLNVDWLGMAIQHMVEKHPEAFA